MEKYFPDFLASLAFADGVKLGYKLLKKENDGSITPTLSWDSDVDNIGPIGLNALSQNLVSTINGVFHLLSFSSSTTLTFLQEGVIVGFRNFAWGFKQSS